MSNKINVDGKNDANVDESLRFGKQLIRQLDVINVFISFRQFERLCDTI